MYDDSVGSGGNFPSRDSVAYRGQWGAYTDIENLDKLSLHLRGDYYSAQWGRWLTRQSAGVNDYSAGTDPVDSWIDPLQDLLSLVGIFDPSGLVDLVNAGVYALRGRWAEAGLSMVAIVPAVGDVAKVASYADEVADTLKAAARSPYAIGRAGEEAVGIIGKKTRITLPTGRFRVPDQVDRAAKVVREVKNVTRLSYTRQLRDYALWAQQQGYTFELIVRQTTRLSRPLQEAIERGEIILIRGDLPW